MRILLPLLFALALAPSARGQLAWPPALPDGKPTVTLDVGGVRVDFLYFPGQTYAGRPWSAWGQGSVSGGGDRYWTAIGDHGHPRGTALIYEYDAAKGSLRLLADVGRFLQEAKALPEGSSYTPGKVHTRIVAGSDAWLYYATHRGSDSGTTDAQGYRGDWILRTHPSSGKTEVVAAHPVAKHSIPAGFLDPERLLFYGGTAAGRDAPEKGIRLLVWDVRQGKLRLQAADGFQRAAIFSRSTGCVYWDGKKYDPATGEIGKSQAPAVRSATAETARGVVYGTTGRSADVWAYDVRKDALETLGSAAVGKAGYTAAIEVDPTGRFLYLVPGAHGGAEADGTPVVQFDLATRKPRAIVKLHPALQERVGYVAMGTYSIALSPAGDRLFVTWNGSRAGPDRRGRYRMDTCALTVIHIPEALRR